MCFFPSSVHVLLMQTSFLLCQIMAEQRVVGRHECINNKAKRLRLILLMRFLLRGPYQPASLSKYPLGLHLRCSAPRTRVNASFEIQSLINYSFGKNDYDIEFNCKKSHFDLLSKLQGKQLCYFDE
jgi:hypothetical protein